MNFLFDSFLNFRHLDGHDCILQELVDEVLRSVVHLFIVPANSEYTVRISDLLTILFQSPVNVTPLELEPCRKLPDRNFFNKVEMLEFLDQLKISFPFC